MRRRLRHRRASRRLLAAGGRRAATSCLHPPGRRSWLPRQPTCCRRAACQLLRSRCGVLARGRRRFMRRRQALLVLPLPSLLVLAQQARGVAVEGRHPQAHGRLQPAKRGAAREALRPAATAVAVVLLAAPRRPRLEPHQACRPRPGDPAQQPPKQRTPQIAGPMGCRSPGTTTLARARP